MKVGDLVRWKSAPGFIALVIEIRGSEVYDLFFGTHFPKKLKSIERGGIVQGFAPWELVTVSEISN